MKVDFLSLQAIGVAGILILLVYWRAARSRRREGGTKPMLIKTRSKRRPSRPDAR